MYRVLTSMGLAAPALVLAALIALPCAAQAQAPNRAQPTCAALAQTTLPHATVTSAKEDQAGDVKVCRIAVTSRPTSDSDIRIEVWIPMGQSWNGKYLQIGNGGLAGMVQTPQLAGVAARGFAAAGTDGGHQQPAGEWGFNHPEKWEDFGWRSLKETTDIAKLLIRAYRGGPPSLSYFAGCSEGGREALMEAQRFPEDFDGIVAGAPAVQWSRILSFYQASQQAIVSPDGFLSSAKLNLLQRSALAACDPGKAFVRDPTRCAFDPRTLLCADQELETCLTKAQLATVQTLYDGLRNPQGQVVYPGFTPGAESVADNWRFSFAETAETQTHAPTYLGASFIFQSLAFRDPAADVMHLTPAQRFAVIGRLAAVMDVSPDLSAFRRRGGKLLQFHGWADGNIPALGSILYYEDVRKTLGGDVDDFYQLYMVPGMFHCTGGPGPTGVDWVDLLERWVASDKTPGEITAVNAPATPYLMGARQQLSPYRPAKAAASAPAAPST